MKNQAKLVLSLIGISSLLLLCTCWFRTFSGYAAGWIEGICFFELAWFCTHYLQNKDISSVTITLSIVFGRILLELPIRIMDFRGSLGSLMVTIICIVAIILGVVCYQEKRPIAYILSTIVLILLNTFAHHFFLESLKLDSVW